MVIPAQETETAFAPRSLIIEFTTSTRALGAASGPIMDGEVCLLFLLRDDDGRGLVLAEAPEKSTAEQFGRTHFPDFSDALEIDPNSHAEAEEFWGVQTVRVVNMPLRPPETVKHYWVRGPVLPPEVEEDGLLTIEDRCALTLDHIERTSEFVVKLQIKTRYTQPTVC